MYFLHAVVVVKHLTKPVESSILHVPETVRQEGSYTKPVVAEVVAVGNRSTYRGELSAGDKVYVPFHLGSRRTVDGNNVIIYDDEDVLAKID